MIVRYLNVEVPVRPDDRRQIGWALEAGLSPTGPWRSVNGGKIEDEDRAGATVIVVGRFGDRETHARVTFVAEGGSWQGGRMPLPPIRLAPDGEVTEVSARGSRPLPGRIIR